MGAVNAWTCDGPGCEEMIRRREGERSPSEWIHLTVKEHAEAALRRAQFHSAQCAVAWLEHDLNDGHEIPRRIADEPGDDRDA